MDPDLFDSRHLGLSSEKIGVPIRNHENTENTQHPVVSSPEESTPYQQPFFLEVAEGNSGETIWVLVKFSGTMFHGKLKTRPDWDTLQNGASE